ncbi:2-iminoacetate synthase [Clostridium acetobutylicum]|uniref:Thiamine biosynthesis enzyme, thiH n=1 Tax=Clostridium acetobutylicum (strain ATCC 824 / DSM 792 / JCM 1419 / IAM 19013 / LMG 5710 / NBRC 13948 / NRRL B-527 / VKM B-1787 / 2291 / W) TaxID=272562 RepID=Q97F33_CLOAB|nr:MULTISPECIES: 2-iminoacetate synthase ThiH [Clostridium]AAK80863.1 Thiamine biosynthesis enzyme, thiH [Clostridium acetobutylicum ATCC 824]ADZ21965.1 thiamine biosynthesis protein [Clostridium acetobutylicum EA 2018]AEI34461.1 thiamine biosynthesis protein ThiH [Clostridium acetobutylicum DSM 1731]AWV78725.1 2-iminoacetate synthase ThiH [Clostridium acetobutylicum]MBC2393588.1 2-iminoacetate synthase ThiH [Clostridium acetobutylicum]
MSFYKKLQQYKDFDFDDFFSKVTARDIEKILCKDILHEMDFLKLLSPAAEKYLEHMAQKARELSLKNFGKTVVLYTPIYIANYCVNGCAYCGYNVKNKIKRKQLTMEEIEEEARAIYSSGMRNIILLTGESKVQTPVSYIKDAIKLLKKYFSSICIEIYPLEVNEYRELVEAGADSLTIYQETYNEEKYSKVHLSGPKRNFKFRLDAPERVCEAGIHSIGTGALLGLYKWRSEAFFTGLHASYIQEKFPSVEISMSAPRIRPHAGSFDDIYEVNDKNIVQVILAYKMFLPRAGTNITTREPKEFRDKLIPIGVTKMSAGVSTEVGGHGCKDKGEGQFDTNDKRSVSEVYNRIKELGYNPVFKDFENAL